MSQYFTYSMQNTLGKVKKIREIEEDKTSISLFLTASAKHLFMKKKLDTRLCFYPNLRFS